MKLYKQITVDLYHIFPMHKIEAQQNNIGRGVIITLTADEEVIDASGEDVKIWAKKPNGEINYLPCEVLYDGRIKADFSSQILSASGKVRVSLELISQGDDITTPLFEINVGENIADHNAAESEDKFSALQQALAQVNEYRTSDTMSNTVSFENEDTNVPESFVNVELLKSGEEHKNIFNKISKVFRNVRRIISLIGTTEISQMADGTLTGIVNEHEKHIGWKFAGSAKGSTGVSVTEITDVKEFLVFVNTAIADSTRGDFVFRVLPEKNKLYIEGFYYSETYNGSIGVYYDSANTIYIKPSWFNILSGNDSVEISQAEISVYYR